MVVGGCHSKPNERPPCHRLITRRKAGPRPDYLQWVNNLTLKLFDPYLDATEFRQLLADYDVSYIYIGQRQGIVNNPGPSIDVEQLLNDPDLAPIYHEDRVWIFKVYAKPNGGLPPGIAEELIFKVHPE